MELDTIRKNLYKSQKNEELHKRSLAKNNVELKLLRQLNYLEKQDSDEANFESNVEGASSIMIEDDKTVWKAISKAASTANNKDDDRSLGDCSNSSVNRQMKKNVLRMLIRNLHQEGNNDKEKSNDGNGILNVNKPRRKQRQLSNCSDISADDWDTCSDSFRPKKQNSLKKFFNNYLTTLQDEGEKVLYEEDDNDSTTIDLL